MPEVACTVPYGTTVPVDRVLLLAHHLIDGIVLISKTDFNYNNMACSFLSVHI